MAGEGGGTVQIHPADEDTVQVQPEDESMAQVQPEDESTAQAQPAGEGALPTIRLATILGLLATAALLGVVSATAGLGVAGRGARPARGSAATPPPGGAPLRSDQPAIFPAGPGTP